MKLTDTDRIILVISLCTLALIVTMGIVHIDIQLDIVEAKQEILQAIELLKPML
jgi:hypothetical protein